MRARLFAVLFALAVAVSAAACVGAGGPAETIEPPPRSDDELVARFLAAHERADAESLRRLVDWEGVDEPTRLTIESGMALDFGLKVKNARIEPIEPGAKLEYRLGGITYRPTIPPTGRLRIEFEPSQTDASAPQAASYLVGVKDGAHVLVASAPAG